MSDESTARRICFSRTSQDWFLGKSRYPLPFQERKSRFPPAWDSLSLIFRSSVKRKLSMEQNMAAQYSLNFRRLSVARSPGWLGTDRGIKCHPHSAQESKRG